MAKKEYNRYAIVFKPRFNLSEKPLRGVASSLFETREDAEEAARDFWEDDESRWFIAEIRWEE